MRSKVFINFGTRSKVWFGTRPKFLIIFVLFCHKIESFIIFGTRSKVIIMLLKTFDHVPKVASYFLVQDRIIIRDF
jgi:hypothetical protein